MSMPDLSLTKLNATPQAFSREKLRHRLLRLCDGLDQTHVDVDSIVMDVERGLQNAMPTRTLDQLLAETAANKVTHHPDYGLLGGRICVSSLHKHTSDSVLETFEVMRAHTRVDGRPAPLIHEAVFRFIQAHPEELQAMVRYERDMRYEFFGFKTLERAYLIRIVVKKSGGSYGAENRIVERPQHLLLRVALGIHVGTPGLNDLEVLERIRETYDLMSLGWFTHATPTLFNSGTTNPQLSSCFLVAMKGDSIEGIYDTLKEVALISKAAGGIGLHVHSIRSTGSFIAGTNGFSNGLVPMLRVFNNTARYVDQGGGKRKGSFAIYLEPWHADIQGFLMLKRNTGNDEHRARDLFYGLWIPDLFMKRVESKSKWTLFDPHTAPGLEDVWGEEFEMLYEKYEAEGRGVEVMDAHTLWFLIIESQIETGTPYMVYKDACNRKSNQRNLGTIKCSNLCTEIVEYTSPDETAVCNLASIALPMFVNREARTFDYQRLRDVTKVITRNLNRVIDVNFYPVEEARRSNMRHRPVGIGVQGLADTFILLRLPFASEKAKELNAAIFETIYFAALEASCELAQIHGPYETFRGSPASEGLLQFDLWNHAPPAFSPWDWNGLRQRIQQHGLRNSLLLAPMPTASTSQILGNNECFEPFTSNIYVRRVLSGEFPVVNKHLVVDLIQRGLWNHATRQQIIARNGSVQYISAIPPDLKELYKTVWEIKQKDIIDMAVARGRYIDQSQSLNLFLERPTIAQITSMHFYGWKKGLKTGMYYLRTRPAVDAIKFTVDPTLLSGTSSPFTPDQATVQVEATAGDDEKCLSCGS